MVIQFSERKQTCSSENQTQQRKRMQSVSVRDFLLSDHSEIDMTSDTEAEGPWSSQLRDYSTAECFEQESSAKLKFNLGTKSESS